MRKEITSLLVLVAAVLLAVPTQAQTVARKAARSQVKVFQTAKFDKQAAQKARNAQLKAAQVAAVSEVKSDDAAVLEVREASVAGISLAKWNWAAHEAPQFVPQSGMASLSQRGKAFGNHNITRRTQELKTQYFNSNAPNASRRAAGETVDAYGVITAIPEGDTKIYQRTGIGWYRDEDGMYYEDQGGNAEITELEDGTVYFKDFLSEVGAGTYVKGTREGNTITIPVGQVIYYWANYGYGLKLGWATYDSTNGFNEASLGDAYTLTVDEAANTITLEGTYFNFDNGAGTLAAAVYTDDDAFAGFGDNNTVFSYDPEYVAPEPTTLPDGVVAEEWFTEGNTNSQNGAVDFEGTAKVAIVGDKVYLGGLFSQFPDSYIVGTIEGNQVTFESLQFLGNSGSYEIYATGTDRQVLTDFVMTYDAAAQTLTGVDLLANAATDKIYYLSWIENILISKNEIEHEIAPVDVLPYSYDFSSAKDFTIIDVNGGSTWSISNGAAQYKWDTTQAGDDWLVSPAIKLVAGKKYHFAIDAKAQMANYAEKFEVKAATEATAEALAAGATVIEEQTITNTALATFENEEFTVAADGYYYIGIHATSDADKYYLTVDNFLIEAAPLSAPITLDLTQQDNTEYFSVIDNNGDGKTWSWNASYGVYYSYSSTNAADDYAILPIKLEGGKNYNVIVEVAAGMSSYAEKFEVVAGKAGTIDALTTTVIAEKEVSHTTFEEYDGVLTTDEAGIYYIAIHATSDADKYYLKVKTITVEVGAEGDAPAAVDNFAVVPVDEDELGAVITFNAPTKSLDGSIDLAAGDIAKIEILRDGAVINTIETPAPGAALSYTDKGADLTIGNHTYQAVTYGEGGIGGKSEEVTVFLSATLTVPYTADFTQQATFETFQVINNNNDGASTTWRWDASYSAYYTYSQSNDADDYLVSSPIKLEAGKNYKVTVSARSYSGNYPERFEVVYGTEATAAGLTNVALAATDVATGEYEEFEGDFNVTADGNYYVAIHAISDKDMWRLQVNKLSIEKGLEADAPVAPELTVVPGAEGALSAAITVTAPATSIDGAALPASNLTKIEILRDGEVIATETPAPGAVVNYTDNDVTTGNHTYQAIPYDAAGEAGQKSQKVTIYVGEDELGDVQNFAVAGSTPTTIDFTWDEIAGKNGGYVNVAGVKYHIYSLEVKSNGYWQYLDIVDELATVEGATQATVNFSVDEGQSNYQYFGISAENAAGETDATEAYTYIIVGAPEELPIIEGFAGNKFHYNWNTNGGAYISELDSDGDGTALKLISEEDNTTIYFQLDKVNLASAANPTLLFDVHSGNISQVRVIGAANAGTPSVLKTVALTDEWQTVKVPLTDIISGRSTVGFQADFVESSYVSQYGSSWGDTLLVDNIKIVDLLEYNLQVALKAPKSVTTGQTAAIQVTVLNTGENAAQNYTVKLTAGDDELLNETVAEALGSYESKTFDAELATTLFTEAGDVTLTAMVEYANDLDEDDNETSDVITVKLPGAAPVEDLAAELSGDVVNLTWSAPSAATTEVTDDVEAYDDNDNGGLYENDTYQGQTGQIGEWTVYDGNNGLGGYGFQGLTSDLGNPGSWIVFNPLAVDASLTNYVAHSGDKYFISACVAEPDDAIDDTDNWLISPELPGVAQTISFFVRELVTDYGEEKYEIWASSTDKQISSFQKIASQTIDTNEWTEVSFDLPEGTKYFAIRHTSNDVWALLVDDITYLAGGGEVESYNVYVDETFNQNVTETTATVGDLENSEVTFSVTAVYAGGIESAPVSVTVSDITTGIEQLLATGKTLNIYTVDGKLVRQNVTKVDDLNNGLYIVNGKKVVVK